MEDAAEKFRDPAPDGTEGLEVSNPVKRSTSLYKGNAAHDARVPSTVVSGHRLQPHPRTPGELDQRIEVGVAADSGALRLRYHLVGDLGRIRIPGASGGARADGLWKHTCFEAFVRVENAPHYLELNFSPSGQWAAYLFDNYREGMRPLELGEPPAISVSRESTTARVGVQPGLLVLDALVNFPMLSEKKGQTLRLGLSAVVEDDSGGLSYWALRHLGDLPDFHDSQAWALELLLP